MNKFVAFFHKVYYNICMNKSEKHIEQALPFVNKSTGKIFISLDGDVLINPLGKCIPNNETLFEELDRGLAAWEITKAQKLTLNELIVRDIAVQEKKRAQELLDTKIVVLEGKEHHFKQYIPR